MDTPAPLTELQQAFLDMVYELAEAADRWPEFSILDRYLYARYAVGETLKLVEDLPKGLVQPPWSGRGYQERDPVSLTLRGVRRCQRGPDDLVALLALVQWTVRQNDELDPAQESFTVDSVGLCKQLGLDLGELPGKYEETEDEEDEEGVPTDTSEPPSSSEARSLMRRLRILCEGLPNLWSGAGWDSAAPWLWTVTINRSRIRAYNTVESIDDLVELQEQVAREAHEFRQRTSAAARPDRRGIESEGDLGRGDGLGHSPEDPQPTGIWSAPLRQEVVDAACSAVDLARYDEAVLGAFKAVEEAVQRRTGTTEIGDRLLRLAFGIPVPQDDGRARRADSSNGTKETDRPKPRIQVSERTADADRLFSLFSGALGLLRADRAHKSRPALTCRTAHECLRILAYASMLLDLLDRDLHTAPLVTGFQQTGDLLSLNVERATARTNVLIDETPCPVVHTAPGTVTVSLAGVPRAPRTLALTDGDLPGAPHRAVMQGPSIEISLSSTTAVANWYRVERTGIPVYDGSDCSRQVEGIAAIDVTLYHGGVVGRRWLVTRQDYRPGDYLVWRFQGNQAPEAWVRGREGEPACKVHEGGPVLDGDVVFDNPSPLVSRLSLEPALVKLRLKESAPLRALRWMNDGFAEWPEWDTAADTPSNDQQRLNIKTRGSVKALMPGDGQATYRSDENALHFARSQVEVAAFPAGTVTPWMTQLPPVSDMAFAGGTIFFTTREADVWRVGPGQAAMTAAARIPLRPPLFQGCDRLAVSSGGSIAVSLVGQSEVFVVQRQDGDYAASLILSPPGNAVVTAIMWLDEEHLLVATHTSGLWEVPASGGTPRFLGRPPRPLYRLAPAPDGQVLGGTAGSAAAGLWRFDPQAPEATTDVLPSEQAADISAVACAPDGGVYLTRFHAGVLQHVDTDSNITTLYSGGRTLQSLAVCPQGAASGFPPGVYVGELVTRSEEPSGARIMRYML